MKRVISFLLAAAMMTGAFAGCGQSQSSSSSQAAGSTAASAAASENVSGQSVTITTWNEPSKDDALNMYKQAEKATGVKVNVTVIPESDYSSKLGQMVSTKDTSTDIMVVWENDLKNFAEAKGIVSLDSYLQKSTINTKDFIPAVSQLSSGMGATYGLPWCAATEILYYNKDMFKAAGISLPTNNWKYDDFKAAAKKLTKNGVYGCALPNTQTWWAGVGGAGDKIYAPSNGQMVIGSGATSFIKDCKVMVDAKEMPAPSSDTTDLFAAGKAAMAWQGSWNIGTYADKLKFDWDIASLPTNKVKYNTLHTGFYTINANSKKQTAACKVIEYLMSEEGQTINSKASGNPSALKTIANKGAWKVEAAKKVTNWDAITDSLNSGIFGYTCLPSGVTNNAVSKFNSSLLGEITPADAVKQASDYAAETIGY
jgi:multiple sugar transport system substrate-binding protein